VFDVFVTSNGPGEITSWVLPFVKHLKNNFSEIRISLFLVPCRFSTGEEYRIAEEIEELDYVFHPKEFYFKLIKLPFQASQKGCVVFLGGDLLNAVLLKKRYSFPAIAYTEGYQGFRKSFYKFFLRDIDGDLMLSYFDFYKEDKILSGTLQKTKNIVFLPGSRLKHFTGLVPLFADVSKHLPSEYKVIFIVSSFIPDSIVQDMKTLTNNKFLLIKNKTNELIKEAEICISIPGTNNMQLAYWNKPSLIVFPFNKPEVVDFPGLIGLITNIPGFKNKKKKLVLNFFLKKNEFCSIVNKKENKLIFPELIGDLTAEQIANKIVEILNDTKLKENIIKNCKLLPKKSPVLKKMLETIKSFYYEK
jgi:hypothetical protein